jgi:GntR family transcriptional regulator
MRSFAEKVSRSTGQGSISYTESREILSLLQYGKDIPTDRGELMNIFIDNKSGAPIYDQIFNQIKSQIISGALKEDEALPSIRNLAKDLKISVVTTKRAYDELEREGFIYTIAAKGCFVAPKNVELIREANLRKIEEMMGEIGKLAASCGLSKQELIEMFEYISEEE